MKLYRIRITSGLAWLNEYHVMVEDFEDETDAANELASLMACQHEHGYNNYNFISYDDVQYVTDDMIRYDNMEFYNDEFFETDSGILYHGGQLSIDYIITIDESKYTDDDLPPIAWFDYVNQCYVVNGLIQCCGHNDNCSCYGKLHAGAIADIRHYLDQIMADTKAEAVL